MAACTNPGTPDSQEWKKWKLEGLGSAEAALVPGESEMQARKRGWSPGVPNKCDTCKQLRPERAHHCGVCRVCVLRMDHHCPWIGNCIGWGNHKFFLLLNIWAAAALSSWIFSLAGPSAQDTLKALLMNEADITMLPFMGLVISMVLLLVTFFMALYSVYMAATNYTTIEEMFKGANPYAYSSYAENLRQLLGPFDFKLLLPLKPVRVCDGVSFPMVGSSGDFEVAKANDCTRYGSSGA